LVTSFFIFKKRVSDWHGIILIKFINVRVAHLENPSAKPDVDWSSQVTPRDGLYNQLRTSNLQYTSTLFPSLHQPQFNSLRLLTHQTNVLSSTTSSTFGSSIIVSLLVPRHQKPKSKCAGKQPAPPAVRPLPLTRLFSLLLSNPPLTSLPPPQKNPPGPAAASTSPA
jgi:hypothetical protein